ncbi:MAG: hypothetical protein JXB48_09430 [Candidatus Latescibacteria bacterium]|nr:hypothetical protein [Candidatus Latescibacterota bacterium]
MQQNNQVCSQIDISYIDRQIKESKTFEFDYYGNYDYLKNAADSRGVANLNNKLMLNRNIEKTHWGNWQNVNFEIARYNNKGNKTQVTKFDARLGGKYYLGNSPYFLFGVFEANHYGVKPGPETEKEDIFEGNGIYSFFMTGGGGGRVLDIANDIRVNKVQELLLKRELISQEFPQELYNKIKDRLRQKKESSKRVIELNTLLIESGVLNVERFDVSTVVELTRILDESADRLESGIEWRGGLGHELSKENSRQDNLKLVGGRVYYGKAINDRLGFTETMDLLKGWANRGSGINLKSLSKITYSMVKTELSVSYWLTADRREYTVAILDNSTGTSLITKNDYNFSKYFNEISIQYSYEIYNKINLSVLMKINRRDYHNDFEISSQKKGWNRELHALINYEIF